ncbi:MAG: hypothetical protein NUV93_05810 [Firmicutes bacterium]|jgi:hypothetical protein|nr:hypothetical protein [Bacillota bacterium]
MAIPLENVVPVSVEDTVRDAVCKAMEYARQKSGCASGAALQARLAARDEWAMGYLSYAVAGNIAASVAALDQRIQEAHLLGLEGGDEGAASHPAVLILTVTCRTAALDSIVARVTEILPRVLGEIAGLDQESSACFMDVEVVEEADVGMRKGLGAAVGSLWTPPLKVWARK